MHQGQPIIAPAATRDQRRSRTPFLKRTEDHHQQQQRQPQPASSSTSSSLAANDQLPSITQPAPTVRALVPEGGVDALRRQLVDRAEVVTVRSTIEASPTAGTRSVASLPLLPGAATPRPIRADCNPGSAFDALSVADDTPSKLTESEIPICSCLPSRRSSQAAPVRAFILSFTRLLCCCLSHSARALLRVPAWGVFVRSDDETDPSPLLLAAFLPARALRPAPP